MKLNEASTVFLIIGGVLLGQIEVRQRTPQPCDPTVSPCFSYETTAETCARAMREIGAGEGAIPNTSGGGPAWTPNGKWFLGGQRVLCVPSPSGLTR